MATIFFSYSHVDEGLRDQLETHLSVLKNQGVIEAWHDRRITAGDELDTEIDVHLESADLILLLVSSDFLASDYCYRREMTRAMERHASKSAIVIPVILRPCDWHDTPFGKLLAAPKDGRPITQWPNIDEAFLDVVKAIKRALPPARTKLRTQLEAEERSTLDIAASADRSRIRSSNLRVAKVFSQLDKDQFLHDGFDYISKYFENSLQELVARNPGINRSFRRIDADRFTAAIYRDGEKVCQCTVYLGGFESGIAYVASDNARMGSLNESLSVEADEQCIYFKALGMQSYGQANHKMSFEGAAEFYWTIFVRPIQQ